jgi:tetratricopeptide (TPR) repeat protein
MKLHLATGAIAVAVLAVAVAAYVWTSSRTPAPADDVTRVAVAAFENRTGDKTLDRLGQMVADSLVQGTRRVGVATIVPHTAGTAASMIVMGDYSQTGSVLEFHARLVDASSGAEVHAIEVVRVTRSTPDAGVEAIRQRVLGAVGAEFDEFVPLHDASHAPTYDAFREYDSGTERLEEDDPQALRHFELATEIDPAFVAPRLQLAISYVSLGRAGDAAQVIAPLAEGRDRLTAFERLLVDACSAMRAGRRDEALGRLRDAAQLAPQNVVVNYWLGSQLVGVNQPQAALDTLATVPDSARGSRRPVAAWRFGVAARARHMLADYAGERVDVRQALRIAPQSLTYRTEDAAALAGLGKPADAMRVVDDLLAQPGPPGPFMMSIALELRAHGHVTAARELAARTVAWYANRPPDVAPREATRYGLGRASYIAERWDVALEAFRALVRDFPNDLDYLGYLGAVQARRGDRGEAARVSAALRRVTRPDFLGRQTYWCARIASLLGDESSAVDLLRDAFSQGMSFSIDIHREMDFEALRGFAPFRELVTR